MAAGELLAKKKEIENRVNELGLGSSVTWHILILARCRLSHLSGATLWLLERKI